MEKECIVCNIKFKVKPSHFNKRFCCSKVCQAKSFKTKLTGEKNPNYKGKNKIFYSCINCNVKFLTRRPQHPTKCCSKKCVLEWYSKCHKGKKITKEATEKQKASHRLTLIKKGVIDPVIRKRCGCGNTKDEKAKTCISCFYKRIERVFDCLVCGKNVSVANNKTCSKECSKKHKIKLSLGANNPNWKGGIKTENQRQRNHLTYKEWRFSVYKRDNYTCQDCGKTNCYLHAHHIKGFSKHPELRTNINNGKTLCVPCHAKYHNSLNVKNYKKQQL